MQAFKGVIVNFFGPSKKDPTRNGFFCRGQGAPEGWVTVGKDLGTLKLEKGNVIDMDCKTLKAGGLVATSITVTAKEAPAKGGGKWGGKGGGGYRDDPAKQASIVMQHSQDMAVKTVELLLGAGAVKLGAEAGRETIIAGLIDGYTTKYAAQAAVKSAGAKPAPSSDDETVDEPAPAKAAAAASTEDETEDEATDDFDNE